LKTLNIFVRDNINIILISN